MELISKVIGVKDKLIALNGDSKFENSKKRAIHNFKSFLLKFFRFLLLVSVCFVIITPMLTILVESFFSNSDVYNPAVYMIPLQATTERYTIAIEVMDYFTVLLKTVGYTIALMAIQLGICSMVGYGFARFKFPFRNFLFACVIITIVIPPNTIMLPLYQSFREFDILGIINGTTGGTLNFLKTTIPMYLLTILGSGLRSGLYIYIFNQFFRGLPKEIEEAAFIDGAGPWYTYFRIMLVNSVPAIITVAVFSTVWQYNDLFYSQLFNMPAASLLSRQLESLQVNVQFMKEIKDPNISQIYLYAGIILVIIPIILIYVGLQKYFMEGVERSGIVG